ncbi:MAG: MT-A70 family methyltransferase [Sedimentisphaerales bacterium]
MPVNNKKNSDTKKYGIIYADVPWLYQNPKNYDSAMGGVSYPTLTLDEIKNLPVNEIADKNCALFFWATMPKLNEAMEVIDAWGFKYTTCAFTWVKMNPKSGGIYSGMGHWTNGNAELCLFAKKGHPKRQAKNVKQIVMTPRGRHSAKPDEIRCRIVNLIGDIPRIELFARQKVDGWDCLGNDIDGRDIREALKELIFKLNTLRNAA